MGNYFLDTQYLVLILIRERGSSYVDFYLAPHFITITKLLKVTKKQRLQEKIKGQNLFFLCDVTHNIKKILQKG